MSDGSAATRRRGTAEGHEAAPDHAGDRAAPAVDTVHATWVDRACCVAFYTLFWGQPFAIVGAVLWALHRVHRTGVAASWPLVAALAAAAAAYVWVTLAWTRGSLRTGTRWLRFCNCSGAQLDPFCVTPCTNPQAKVQFSYTPTGGTATTYSTVYNCPCCCGAIPSFVYLSQVVKQAARCCGILNGKSSFASSGAVFLTDCLPGANVSYATTTTPSA